MKIFFLICLLFTVRVFCAQPIKTSSTQVSRTTITNNTAFFIGHNLTPSTDVLKAQTWTIGSYAAGYGLTDHVMIATSPWIWASYNTKNIHLKWSQDVSPKSTLAFFASYFDSYDSEPLMNNMGSGYASQPSGPGPGGFAVPSATNSNVSRSLNRYQWTSYSLHGLYSYHFTDELVQYFNVKYSYFYNDDMPYSLRMDPGNDNIRDQWDISTLLKVPLNKNGLNWSFELGALGLNYVEAFAHMGTSFSYIKKDWLVQVGASYTVPMNELGTSSGLEVGRYDERVHYTESAKQYYTERYLQVAVHPEVQVQYSF